MLRDINVVYEIYLLGKQYTTYLVEQKQSCNNKYELEQFRTNGFSQCLEHCSNNIDCRFFFHVENKICRMFSSCHEFQATSITGITYEIQEKSNANVVFYFIP